MSASVRRCWCGNILQQMTESRWSPRCQRVHLRQRSVAGGMEEGVGRVGSVGGGLVGCMVRGEGEVGGGGGGDLVLGVAL